MGLVMPLRCAAFLVLEPSLGQTYPAGSAGVRGHAKAHTKIPTSYGNH